MPSSHRGIKGIATAREKINRSESAMAREVSSPASSIRSQTALATSNEVSPDSQSFLVTPSTCSEKAPPEA